MAKQLNWGRPLALVVILVGLGTFAVWSEYVHKPKEEAQEEQAKKIFSLKETPTAGVKVVDGKTSVTLKCLETDKKLCKAGDSSKWEIEAPEHLKADSANADALLSSLNNLTSSETIDLSTEKPDKKKQLLREYMLDEQSRAAPLARRVEVTDSKGETTVLYIGERHPLGDSYFAAVAHGTKAPFAPDENKIYLVPMYVKSDLDHPLTYWRDKKLFSINSHDVQSFELDGSHGQISGTKNGADWNLSVKDHGKTEAFPGDIENVDNMLSAATYLTAKDFTSKDALKGTKRVLELTLKTAPSVSKDPITLTLFGNPKVKKLYATVSNLDPLFELDTFTTGKLDKSAKDLRLMKLLTSVERFSTKRLEFSGKPLGAAPLSLAQKDGLWSIEGDKNAVDQDKVQTLLDKLSGNRIKDIVEGAKIPSGEATGLKLALYVEGKKPATKLEMKRQFVFWQSNSKLYARDLLSARKEAFLLDTAVKGALPWSRDFFKKAAPAPAAPPAPKK